jgi:hypothetical protein
LIEQYFDGKVARIKLTVHIFRARYIKQGI